MTPKKFIKTWSSILIISMLTVALVNIFIDPYGIWNSPKIESLNKIKPAAANKSRFVKPNQVKNFKAQTLIMGNSRPQLGINPESDCWSSTSRPVYNLSISGSTLIYQYRLLQHAIYFTRPKDILYAIDFIDFLSTSKTTAVLWPPKEKSPGFSVNLDNTFNTSYPLSTLIDLFKTVFSLKALSDSIFTIYSQNNIYSSNRTSAGFNTANEYRKIISTEGQFVLFLQKDKEILEKVQKKLYLITHIKEDWSQSFETFKRFLDFNRKNGVHVTVFINPYHTDYLEIIQQSGQWQQFIQWKEKVAEITSGYNNTELWDFALVNKFTSELPPNKGSTKKQLHWFWEPGHYKKELGNLMLAQMLETTCYESEKYPPPGIKMLNVSSYKQYLNIKDISNESLVRDSKQRISKLLK